MAQYLRGGDARRHLLHAIAFAFEAEVRTNPPDLKCWKSLQLAICIVEVICESVRVPGTSLKRICI